MADRVKDPARGPGSYFAQDQPPTRGQYQTIALLACELLALTPPASKADATSMILRLQAAVDIPREADMVKDTIPEQAW